MYHDSSICLFQDTAIKLDIVHQLTCFVPCHLWLSKCIVFDLPGSQVGCKKKTPFTSNTKKSMCGLPFFCWGPCSICVDGSLSMLVRDDDSPGSPNGLLMAPRDPVMLRVESFCFLLFPYFGWKPKKNMRIQIIKPYLKRSQCFIISWKNSRSFQYLFGLFWRSCQF